MRTTMIHTLRRQRETLEVDPIHARIEPVRAYAKQIAEMTGEPFSVMTIPEGSTAHSMGYRYVSIPDDEQHFYLAHGAKLA